MYNVYIISYATFCKIQGEYIGIAVFYSVNPDYYSLIPVTCVICVNYLKCVSHIIHMHH